MGEVWEVAAGGYLGECSAGDGDGDGVVTVEDGADVAIGDNGFGDAADGRIEGFDPSEVREVSGVLATSLADADLLDGAGGGLDGYLDPRSPVQLPDDSGSLLRVALQAEVEAYLHLFVVVILVDCGRDRDRHRSGCGCRQDDGCRLLVLATRDGDDA